MSRISSRRRARGTGSIFRTTRRGRVVWIGRGPGGRPQVEGRTQAEVVGKLAAARPPGPDATVSQWADRWLASIPARVKDSTIRSYKKSVAHIRRHLGGVRLSALTPTRVERFAADLVGDAGLHVNTANKVLAELRNMLSGAVRDRIIVTNPVSLARKPRSVRKGIDPFTPTELANILVAASDPDSPSLFPVALLAATGCRIGECLALDVTDFDAATGRLSITKTFDKEDGARSPKSANGVRTIRVPAKARPALVAAIGRRKAGPLFVSREGNRVIAELVRQAWCRLLRRLGLATRNPHQLRHSVATAMISEGVPLGNVAKYLGDTVETVVETYLHPVEGVDPVETLDRIFC